MDFDRIDRTQRIGDMCHRHQSSTFIQQRLEDFHLQISRIVDGNNAQFGSCLLAQHLPGNDVGVVLHPAQNNLVSGPQTAASITLRDQIDRLCGTAHENDFIGTGCVDQLLHFSARVFVGIRGTLTEGVNTAMHIGVVAAVILALGIYHRLWLLRGGSVIEVHQRLALYSGS